MQIISSRRVTAPISRLGTRYLLRGEATDGRFALVEHEIPPRALAAPTHQHQHEDEYSFVLEGRVGVQIGDQEAVAGPGELVVKPRGSHTRSGTPATSPPGSGADLAGGLRALFRGDGAPPRRRQAARPRAGRPDPGQVRPHDGQGEHRHAQRAPRPENVTRLWLLAHRAPPSPRCPCVFGASDALCCPVVAMQPLCSTVQEAGIRLSLHGATIRDSRWTPPALRLRSDRVPQSLAPNASVQVLFQSALYSPAISATVLPWCRYATPIQDSTASVLPESAPRRFASHFARPSAAHAAGERRRGRLHDRAHERDHVPVRAVFGQLPVRPGAVLDQVVEHLELALEPSSRACGRRRSTRRRASSAVGTRALCGRSIRSPWIP